MDAEARRSRHLLDASGSLTGELDQHTIANHLLLTARQTTGARCAALRIFNEQHTEPAQLLTSGADEATDAAIDALARAGLALGAPNGRPQPEQPVDAERRLSSCGSPIGSPAMRSFLEVPVVVQGEVWGSLHLAEKSEGAFSEMDRESTVILAGWAGIAIENARLRQASDRRALEAEMTLRGLQAAEDLATAIGADITLERVLELVTEHGRALVHARSLAILLREGQELVLRANAGQVDEALLGVHLPISGSTFANALERPAPELIVATASRLRILSRDLGVLEAQTALAQTALLVPMVHRGDAVGALAAFDGEQHNGKFTEDDEQLLRIFAASAATAVVLAQTVQADRLHSCQEAADSEQRRWARELHDDTLQGLAALRLSLRAALRFADLPSAHAAIRLAVAQIEREVEGLRSIIAKMRPPPLEELGLRPAIEGLVDHRRQQSGLQITLAPLLANEGQRPLDPELESVAYRLVQEALTNIVKHAKAKSVHLTLEDSDGQLSIEIQDDGAGFDTRAATQGFGLLGMRERVRLLGGTLAIDSTQNGTLLMARLPNPGGIILPLEDHRSTSEAGWR